jgi:hypothetical protein
MHAWVLAFGASPSGAGSALRTGRSLRLHTLYTINGAGESEKQKKLCDDIIWESNSGCVNFLMPLKSAGGLSDAIHRAIFPGSLSPHPDRSHSIPAPVSFRYR